MTSPQPSPSGKPPDDCRDRRATPSKLNGLYAPPNAARVIQKLSAAAKKAARSPEFAKRIEQEGLEVTASDPAELDRYVKAEEVRWRKIVKENNIKPE